MMNISKNQVNIKPNKGIFKVVVVVAILVIFFGCIYVGVNWLKKNPDKNTLHEYDDVRTYTYGGKEYTVKDISAWISQIMGILYQPFGSIKVRSGLKNQKCLWI